MPAKWNKDGYAEEIKREDVKSKATLTTIANFKGGFGSDQLGKDPIVEPTTITKNK